MKIVSVDAIPLAASFERTFRFGTTDRRTSPNVIVVLRTDDGITGYGEACPVPAFTGETQTSITEIVAERVAPALIGQDPQRRVPLLESITRRLVGCPFTLAAVDMALLDLVGKALDVPAHVLLGGAFRGRVEVHGSVGWDEDPAIMIDTALVQRDTYRWLKLYAGRGDLTADLDRLEAVRNAVGETARFLLDVNGLWTYVQTIQALPRLVELGVEVLEQPMAPSHGRQPLALSAAAAPQIAADESVFTPQDAAAVARSRTASIVNIGQSKLGGPTHAHRTAQVAAAVGLGVMVGSVIEMGVANAAGLQLAAALPHLSYPSYLIGPVKYAQQICEPTIQIVDAHVAVPPGPGLGVVVDEKELARLDARRRL